MLDDVCVCVCVCVRAQPVYVDIACNKFGSRSFDSLWNAASLDQRQLIAKCLTSHSQAQSLRGNQFGSFIYEHCGLDRTNGHRCKRPTLNSND